MSKYTDIATELLLDLYIHQNLSKPEIKEILHIPLTSLNTLLQKRGIIKSPELIKQMQRRIAKQVNQQYSLDKKIQKSINCKVAWHNRTDQQKEAWINLMRKINSRRSVSHQNKLNEAQKRVRELETIQHKKTRLYNVSIGTKKGMANMSEIAKQLRNLRASEGLKKAWAKKSKADKEIITDKIFSTKFNRHNVSTSKQEETSYLQLCERGVTVLRNYKSKAYPFHCDLYLKELDLYIELNYHWTHGSCKFNANDSMCIAKLNYWKEKAITSKYYKQAIQVWTERDLNKFKIAEKNNLNYLTFYTPKAFTSWVNKLVKPA